MSCISKITANLTYDCVNVNNRAKAGIETKAVLINKADIDYSSLTQSGATVSSMVLLSGRTGYDVSWIKTLGNVGSEFSINDGFDTFQQSFDCRVFGQGAADSTLISQLSLGEFVIVYETKYKGVGNTDAFKILGLENGLKMSEGSFSSAENDGSFIFKLSSLEGFGERYPYQVYLNGTYAASRTKFDNNFL
jgi:hypothetical protein